MNVQSQCGGAGLEYVGVAAQVRSRGSPRAGGS